MQAVFELAFAKFLDDAPDVVSFAKNYLAVGFKIDYVKADGGDVWVVETKGRAELDLPQKMNRLRQWCEDATLASVDENGIVYRFVYVDQAGFEKYPPSSFSGLVMGFTEYQQ